MKKKIIYISLITLFIMIIGYIIFLQMNKKEILQSEVIEQEFMEEPKESEIINNIPDIEQKLSTNEVENVDNNAEIKDEIINQENAETQTKKESVTGSKKETQSTIIKQMETYQKQEQRNENQELKQESSSNSVEAKEENNTKIVEQKQEIKQETAENKKQDTTTVTTTKKEEFKPNNEMVQKLINIINSNQSEYMKEYGYNVVIDSSIVNQTSQFTFTEQRVKDKIIFKFGTIKLYAQDYYVNGQYLWTECYII